MMKFINIKMLIISISFFLPFSLFAQSPTFTKQANMNPNRMYIDSTAKMPVLNTDRTFATNKDSIGQFWMRPDSAKMFIRLPGNLIKAVATEDNSIRNQSSAIQVGNFAIDGRGGAARFVAAHADDNTTFNRFYSFSRDQVDTTKQLWSIGILAGTPGGGPGHSGGNIAFRAHTTTGTFLRDAMIIARGGTITIPLNLQLGSSPGTTTDASTFSGTKMLALVRVDGSFSAAGGIVVKETLQNGTSILQNKTTTVTGDYTVGSDDLYINVNNTADCTITIPNANNNPGLQGRLLYIKKTINNAFNVNITTVGGTQNIDGGTTITISAFKASLMLHDDGSNWFIY